MDSLSEQVQTSSTQKNEIIKRKIRSDLTRFNRFESYFLLGKQILILSESSKKSKDEEYLIRSLEDIIDEKTFNFSSLNPSLITQVSLHPPSNLLKLISSKIDQLIDICFDYHIYPRINFSTKELTLRGDRCSLIECYSNLCNETDVYQYTYRINDEEEILNPYLSLNIDQSYLLGEHSICLKDNEQSIYYIDLKNFQLKLNQNKQIYSFQRKKLNRKKKIFFFRKNRINSRRSSSIIMVCIIHQYSYNRCG